MTTLGVVYGDIGTSPLDASRACFNADSGLAATGSAVYGVLSRCGFSSGMTTLLRVWSCS